jgi:rod shape-determining protein MreC
MPLSIPRATRHRLLALILLAFCALSVAFPRPWHHGIRHVAQAAACPALAVLSNVRDGARRLLDRAQALWTAADEVERLRHENRALREALARRSDQAHRAELRLRAFSQLHDFAREDLRQAVRLVPARVIGVDTSTWRHSVIINRGSDDGLALDAPAVWGTSIAGTITALRPSAATVRLLNDSRCGLTARLARTGDVGLLTGSAEPDAHLTLKWIHLHPVERGDLVVTSGIDPRIPPGLVAGRVLDASQTRQPLFYDITVRPLIDLDRVTELVVVLPAPGDAEDLLEAEQQAPPPQ